MLDANDSYILGFLQTDGHRHKSIGGGCSIELSIRDIDILDKIRAALGIEVAVKTRTRNTNFMKDYTTCSLHIPEHIATRYDEFIPRGKKSEDVMAPKATAYSKSDYWRGVIDGDGSLGFRVQGTHGALKPFVALVSASQALYEDFRQYVKDVCGFTFNTTRNKRDGVYNVVVVSSVAHALVSRLYAGAQICLDRKLAKAREIYGFDWLSNNPAGFTLDEDRLVLKSKKGSVPHELSGHHPSSVGHRHNQLNNLIRDGLIDPVTLLPAAPYHGVLCV
jgi:hypothetical protein